MDGEAPTPGQEQKAGKALRRTLLLLSIAITFLGGAGSPVVTRIYFVHGGARLWLTSFLETCGFPITLPLLAVAYFRQRRRRGPGGIVSVTGTAAAACVAIGVIAGLDCYMYAYGSASLPASTSTLLISTALAFTAGFAFLVVRQRFTAYSVNAVVLLVVAPVVLGLQSSGDRPDGVSGRRYYLGFFVMLGAAVLGGLLGPLLQLTIARMEKKKKKTTFVLVLEMQVILCITATVFSAVGMLINKDFQAIPREAKEYGLGERKYYLVLVACAISWQLVNVGSIAIIAFSSALFAGIVGAILLPAGQILPVILLHEKFNSGKGLALALSIWGLASYLYGEHLQVAAEEKESDRGREGT